MVLFEIHQRFKGHFLNELKPRQKILVKFWGLMKPSHSRNHNWIDLQLSSIFFLPYEFQLYKSLSYFKKNIK